MNLLEFIAAARSDVPMEPLRELSLALDEATGRCPPFDVGGG